MNQKRLTPWQVKRLQQITAAGDRGIAVKGPLDDVDQWLARKGAIRVVRGDSRDHRRLVAKAGWRVILDGKELP